MLLFEWWGQLGEMEKRSQNATGEQQTLPRQESFNVVPYSLIITWLIHSADHVLAEQWNVPISHVLGVFQELCLIWETLSGKDTTSDLNFFMYVIAIERAALSFTKIANCPQACLSGLDAVLTPSVLASLPLPLLWSSSSLATGLCPQTQFLFIP